MESTGISCPFQDAVMCPGAGASLFSSAKGSVKW